MKSYKLIDNGNALEVSEPSITSSTYYKDWLISEIARLQLLLDKF